MRCRSASFMVFLVVEINEGGKAFAMAQEWWAPDVYTGVSDHAGPLSRPTHKDIDAAIALWGMHQTEINRAHAGVRP
jgi:hypothetical protein